MKPFYPSCDHSSCHCTHAAYSEIPEQAKAEARDVAGATMVTLGIALTLLLLLLPAGIALHTTRFLPPILIIKQTN